jgi:hypothetical protein
VWGAGARITGIWSRSIEPTPATHIGAPRLAETGGEVRLGVSKQPMRASRDARALTREAFRRARSRAGWRLSFPNTWVGWEAAAG